MHRTEWSAVPPNTQHMERAWGEGVDLAYDDPASPSDTSRSAMQEEFAAEIGGLEGGGGVKVKSEWIEDLAGEGGGEEEHAAAGANVCGSADVFKGLIKKRGEEDVGR
eukprot:g11887.t1